MSKRCCHFSGIFKSDQNLVSKYDSSFGKGDYSAKLSTEIYKIFSEFLKTHHGIITLIEAFVKYNQLRGGDYVTPKEFDEYSTTISYFIDGQLLETGYYWVDYLTEQSLQNISNTFTLETSIQDNYFSVYSFQINVILFSHSHLVYTNK